MTFFEGGIQSPSVGPYPNAMDFIGARFDSTECCLLLTP